MKIFFDTEFTGLHKDTTLISIGLVSEDEKTFYAEFIDYNKEQCDNWINKNVIDNLSLIEVGVHKDNWQETIIKGKKSLVKFYLSMWLSQFDEVELVSDVCHYDMVLFIDLFGNAFDLPKNVNPSCHDINQDIAKYYGCSEKNAFDYNREQILSSNNIITIGDKHNSLYDAKVIKNIYEVIN